MNALSPSDQERALRAFLRGESTFPEFENAFAEYLEFFDQAAGHAGSGVNVVQPIAAYVSLSPAELRPVLQSFLKGTTEEKELSRWALVLMMLDSFENPAGITEAEADEIMDPLWDLLWRLAFRSQESSRSIVEAGLVDLTEVESKLASRAV